MHEGESERGRGYVSQGSQEPKDACMYNIMLYVCMLYQVLYQAFSLGNRIAIIYYNNNKATLLLII